MEGERSMALAIQFANRYNQDEDDNHIDEVIQIERNREDEDSQHITDPIISIIPSSNSSDTITQQSDNINMILMNSIKTKGNKLPKKDILIDSGAQSSVLQSLPSRMSNFKPRVNQSLTFGNGTSIDVEGNGRLGPLSDVAICGGLSENIASVAHMTDQGCVVLFDRHRVMIMRPGAEITFKESEILIQGPRSQDLYRTDLNEFVDQMASLT
jgi:hypothetical protein